MYKKQATQFQLNFSYVRHSNHDYLILFHIDLAI